MKLFRTKKGFVLPLIIGFGFLIAVITIIISLNIKVDELEKDKYIGNFQLSTLNKLQEGKAALLYIDQSARLASYDAVWKMAENSGLILEESELSSEKEFECGSHIYPQWTTSEKECFPNKENSFEYYFKDSFSSMLSLYPDKHLSSAYDILLKQEEKLKVQGISGSYLTFNLAEAEETEYVNYEQAIPIDKQPIIKCSSGACVKGVAEYYYKRYGPLGLGLPYVWGGESPYLFSMTQDDQDKNPDSFFKGVSLSPTQPGKNEMTVPGFDCSGFVWWVFNHAEIPGFKERKDATDYRKYGKDNGNLICGEGQSRCTVDYLIENAEPGDLLFINPKPDDRVGHVAIYVGNGNVMESVSIGLRNVSLADSGYDKNDIQSVYRFNYNTEGEDKFDKDKFEESIGVSISGTSAMFCQGYDLSLIEDELKGCLDYYDDFKNSMSQEGLFNKVDMLFIYSLAFHESGCMNIEELKANFEKRNIKKETWKGGIMQVDACWDKCSDEQIIQMGIEKFSNDYKKIEEFGAKDSKVIITLLLFSYNRGLGAAEKAFKYYDEKGLSLDDAMYKACEDYFNADALVGKGQTGVCDIKNKEQGDLEKCCAGAVTGKNYPNTILNKFYDFCEKAKGEVSEIPVFSYNNIGQYRITPNFQVEIDYDLTIYDELNTVVSEIYDECYDEECVQAKIDEWNEQEGQSFFLDIGYCGKKTNPSKKIFYDLAEEFNYAKNAQEENCYNAFTIDYIDYNVYNTIKPILPDPTEFITSEDIELYLSDKNTENYDFDIVENKVDLFVLKNGDELSLNLGMMPIYQGPCDITKNKIVMCASPVPESQNSVFYNNEPVNIGFSIQLKPEPVESVPEE